MFSTRALPLSALSPRERLAFLREFPKDELAQILRENGVGPGRMANVATQVANNETVCLNVTLTLKTSAL